ncbi:phosphopantothenoylcysteine decarboxylase [Pseudomonas aeruginosa]
MPCDLLIASAAVADYRPEVVAAHKPEERPYQRRGLALQLVRNPDIVTLAHSAIVPSAWASPQKPKTCWTMLHASRRTRTSTSIVANDVANPSIGFNSDENAITVIDRDLHPAPSAQTSKRKIARQLVASLADRLNQQ